MVFLDLIMSIVVVTSNPLGRDDRFPSSLETHGSVCADKLTFHRQPTHEGFIFQGNDKVALSKAFITKP